MWKGIDATLQLAQSPNAKVVIIGAGRTGLPILLGNLDATIAPTTPAQGSPGTGGKTALTPLANTPEASNAEAKTPSTASATMPDDLGSKSSSQLALPPASNTPATDNGTQNQPATQSTTGR